MRGGVFDQMGVYLLITAGWPVDGSWDCWWLGRPIKQVVGGWGAIFACHKAGALD